LCKAASGGSGARALIPIDCPKLGYTIPMLKDILKSSVAYIVPLNTNIDVSHDVVDLVAPEGILKVTCSTCNAEIPLKEFSQHKRSCCPIKNIIDSDSDGDNDSDEMDCKLYIF